MVRKITECDLLPAEVVELFYFWEYFETHDDNSTSSDRRLSEQEHVTKLVQLTE